MNNEIFRLAKECGMQGMLTDVVTTHAELEAFYRAAYNKAIEDAARVAYGTGDEQLESQIRLLEMK